jgi:hypothetical protein
MSFLFARRSRTNASSASCALRRKLFSGVRKKFFTSCWVMVLPPWMYDSAWMLRMAAPTIRKGSSPGWVKKRRSSIASTALMRWSGYSS